MQLLTGMASGEPDAKGEVPVGTINFSIALQFAELAQMRQSLFGPGRRAKRRQKAKPPKAEQDER